MFRLRVYQSVCDVGSVETLWWADATSGDKTAAETNDQGGDDEQRASLDERHDVKSDRRRKMKKERRGEERGIRGRDAFVERRVIPLQLVTRDPGLIRVQIGTN